MYLRHRKGKYVISERFIRTFENKIYKYMTSVSKKMYIDKLDNIVNKYKNTYHSTTKMKSVDLNSNKYNDFNKEIL